MTLTAGLAVGSARRYEGSVRVRDMQTRVGGLAVLDMAHACRYANRWDDRHGLQNTLKPCRPSLPCQKPVPDGVTVS